MPASELGRRGNHLGACALDRMEFRDLPGGDLRVSSVGIATDLEPLPPATGAAGLRMGLRIATALGINFWDVSSVDSPFVDGLLREALGEVGRDTVLSIGLATTRSAHESGNTRGRGPESLEERMLAALDERATRLGRDPEVLLLDDASLSATEFPGVSQLMNELALEGRIVAWGLRCPDARPTADRLARVARSGASLVSIPASLLTAPDFEALAARLREHSIGILVRDPFAGRRLEGGMLLSTGVDRLPTEPPADIERLRSEYAPVLGLGFLARPGRRTLPQSAILYFLGFPEVVSVMLSSAAAPRLSGLVPLEGVPPLSEEDRNRIRASAAGENGASGGSTARGRS